MAELRKGRQTPTISFVLEYEKTKGDEAIQIYNRTGRTAQEWQELLIYDIMGYGDDGLWTHNRWGYSVPRQNGKNEVVAIRELWGLLNGERILHTAHRTTTSHTAWERLETLLNALGYKSAQSVHKADQIPEEDLYDCYKAYGLESIVMRSTGGKINFRTRSSKGGLGESYDLLIIDEAQEYRDDEQSALQYVLGASPNGQTLMCGTPPTPVSSGTVFAKYRNAVLQGETEYSGWSEWSVERMSDPKDKDLWYECNPSMGVLLNERTVLAEVGNDDIDFNIQRLGLWLKYNQKSAISENEWVDLAVKSLPKPQTKLFVGIKFAHNGLNVALSIAYKTVDDNYFTECIDCRPISEGNDWILNFLIHADIAGVAIDGASGQQILVDLMKKAKLKPPTIPTVKDIITANTTFEQALNAKTIEHMNQPSLRYSVSNCEKRAIGSNGGFGYKSILDDVEVALMESTILSIWLCSVTKERKPQKIGY